MNGTDNPAYEYAMAHESVEPDIYFDDPEPEERETPAVDGLRLVFSMLISAAGGDIHRLHVYMAMFAGMSLREAGRQCGRSHEYCRKAALRLQASHPALYAIMTAPNRHVVTAIVPTGNACRWAIHDAATGKTEHMESLIGWPKSAGIRVAIHTMYRAACQGRVIAGRYTITKIHKGTTNGSQDRKKRR